MNCSEGLNDLHILRPNCPSAEVFSMSETQLRKTKSELKNLRQAIVEGLAVNSLDEITPMLTLLVEYRCDPVYKYPSFDFVPMYIHCYLVSSFCGHDQFLAP